jgi:prepilin-type N-terminal cleavage/methylation domain-containing protein
MINCRSAIYSKKGFTLIELLIVIVILAIIAAIAVPVISWMVDLAERNTDEANLQTLNRVTTIYKASEPSQDPFVDSTKTSSHLLGVLADSGFLPSIPTARQQNVEFVWDFLGEKWVLHTNIEEAGIIYTSGDYFSVNSSTKTISGYDGRGGTSITIPQEIGGVAIIQIGQSAMFNGYGSNTWDKLTSVVLPDTLQRISGNAFQNNALTSATIPDSVTYLGANAYYGNLLTSVRLGSGLTEIKGGTFASNRITEIVLPAGIKTIGDGAFQSNAITKITIGEKVTLTKSTSLGNYGNAFNTFYTNNGMAAGTYVYNNGAWSRS